jgi:hypothetical protein
LICLKISPEVTTKLNVFKVINASGEGRCDADSAGNNAKRFRHFGGKPADMIFHHMIITPDAEPDRLPFPQPSDKWLKREVDSHDWMTFINHIFRNDGVENTTPEELEVDAALGL